MRRLTNRLLFLFALAAAAVGAAEQLAWIRAPLPPLGVRRDRRRLRRPHRHSRAAGEGAPGGRVPGRLGGRRRADRRARLFPVRLQAADRQERPRRRLRAEADGGRVEAARIETWPPQLTAIGTLRAYQGVAIAPQVGGVVTAIHFESGDDVAAARRWSNRQFGRAGRPRQRPRPAQERQVALDAPETLVGGGNTPQSSVDAAIAARDSAAAAVERTRAIIAQKAIRAPFAGRARPAQRRPRPVRRASARRWRRCNGSIRSTSIFPRPRRRCVARGGPAGDDDGRRLPGRSFTGQDHGDRRARQRRVAQRDRARRVRQSRQRAAAGHVRQCRPSPPARRPRC